VGRQAGRLLRENFGTAVEVTIKHDRSPVTKVDKESQDLITSYLKREFPHIPIVAEEQDLSTNMNSADKKGPYFVVDPLDGTASFAHGLPFFCVSIAACDGPKVVTGVLVDPIHNEEYTAVAGAGAFLNGNPIKVSSNSVFDELYLNINHSKFPLEKFEKINNNILRKVRRFHKLGSLCLEVAYVASGRLDGTINNDLSMWDIAAAGLIVEEAGGTWSLLDGSKPQFPIFGKIDICASNAIVHRPLIQAMN
jgi:myo-inositol-1(or 4)-monophosphatase